MIDGGDVLFARLKDDATLINLLAADGSGTANVEPGWPGETMEVGDFPKATYVVVADDRNVSGQATTKFGNVRIQVDTWVWPVGASGGRARLIAIDEQLLELLHNKQWTHTQGAESARISSRAGIMSEPPSAAGKPLRRRRDYFIGIG